MRKKYAALLITGLLCILAALPAFAAKPALQAYVTFSMNSVGGVSPTIYYRNNTGQTLKYIDWYMIPYNAVNDPVKSEVGHYTYGQETGPIEPFSVNSSSYGKYAIVNGSRYSVQTDNYGCQYVVVNGNRVYLTASEANDWVLDDWVSFDCMWYNNTVDHIVITKAVITYMNGSKQTISGSSIQMLNQGATFHNDSFETMKKLYADVYDYNEYKAYNPDLAASFGDDEHKYIEHFISSGMKEGRRGKYEFDLATYKANNPDLVAAFGEDNVKYYEHYISSGKNEGRSAMSAVPELEVMRSTFDSSNIKSITNTFYYRNNSGKVIDKIAFTVTAYDKDGKEAKDWDTLKATKTFTVEGPVQPETAERHRADTVYTNNKVSADSPFASYRYANLWINAEGKQLDVYLDKNDQFFVMRTGAKVGEDNSYTYLSQDEIDHAMYKYYCAFNGAWNGYIYNIASFTLKSVTVTYADGLTETIPASRAMSTRRNATLQNPQVYQ